MTYEKLCPYLEKRYVLTHALGVISFDRSTVGIKKASKDSAISMSYLNKELIMLNQDEQLYQILEECVKDSSCTFKEKRVAEEWLKEINNEKNIPTELALEYADAVNEASAVWPDCKNNNDYATFAPYLKNVLDKLKEIVKLKQKENQTSYDVLLDDFLPGFNTEMLDNYFALLKEKIVPLLKQINEKEEIDNSCLQGPFDIDVQKKYVRENIQRLGFDFESGDVFESEHPFTTHFNNHDVRFTNHYNTHNLHAVFSGTHETGHALYEMGIADELSHTPLGEGTSTPMHEGQSRFYENMISGSDIYWKNE